MDKLDDVWATRDYPVLREVTRRFDSGESMPALSSVADTLDMPLDQVKLATAALTRRGLVETFNTAGGPSRYAQVSGDAYFLTGLHPSSDDAVSALVEALRQAADRVDDPDERSRLRRLADGVLGVSTDVIGAVLGAVATRAAGL
ncbi:hypothetical protein [Isoptericola sp. NPDC058082]|uniref:hypothetical protein n=1 Tax=Isoptericola sp. NPDC058082 TaxID=3346331 RepID=UPI0036EF5751